MPTDTEGHGDGESAPSGNSNTYDVIVVGAGAAGVGVSIALIHAGVENFLIVDRDTVGASFDSWPAETRFITPSFPSNSIGMLDLNSIAIGVSPAYSMKIEHPTGPEFAQHLRDIAEYFELPVQENTDVKSIEKKQGLFHLEQIKAHCLPTTSFGLLENISILVQMSLPAVNCAVTPQQFQVMLNWKEMISSLLGGTKVEWMPHIIWPIGTRRFVCLI